MQVNQAEATLSFAAQNTEASFSSVWGNEMQREDFLALASGVRQISVTQMAFMATGLTTSVEQPQGAAE